MLFQVSFLRESLITIIIFAFIWSFLCMNSKMFNEIVPFSESFVTVSSFAFQNLHVFHSYRTFELVNLEFFSFRDDFIYFDLIDIKVLTIIYFYISVLGYLFFYGEILNLLSSYLLGLHFPFLSDLGVFGLIVLLNDGY